MIRVGCFKPVVNVSNQATKRQCKSSIGALLRAPMSSGSHKVVNKR